MSGMNRTEAHWCEETLFTIETPYREAIEVKGWRFGSDARTACFVGAMRGNEMQQMYTASLLVARLKRAESAGEIADGAGILVVPCVNPFSMNIGRRFWPVDNTDINRMFPGYDKGETTQRVAQAVFCKVRDYKWGVQFASYYLSGDFLPHVRIMKTGYQDAETARAFGMQYVIVRESQPIDTTTLNYNWQVFGTEAFSLYTRETDTIDRSSAEAAVSAALRFLNAHGVAQCTTFGAYNSTVMREDELAACTSPCGGLLIRCASPGDTVHKGQTLARILDPLCAEPVGEITAPIDGVVFFACKGQAVTEHQKCFLIAGR